MILTVLAVILIVAGIVLLSIETTRKNKIYFIASIVAIAIGSIYLLYQLYQYFFPSYKCDTEALTFTRCSELDNFYQNCKQKMNADTSFYNTYQSQKEECDMFQKYKDEGIKLGINSCEDAISDLWSWNAKNKTYGDECKNDMKHRKNLAEVMCTYYKEDRNKFMPRINNFEENRLCTKK